MIILVLVISRIINLDLFIHMMVQLHGKQILPLIKDIIVFQLMGLVVIKIVNIIKVIYVKWTNTNHI